jgi:hypothetical protein
LSHAGLNPPALAGCFSKKESFATFYVLKLMPMGQDLTRPEGGLDLRKIVDVRCFGVIDAEAVENRY